MDFVAIDVETANPDLASICQVGIARFSGGQLVDSWVSLIDPMDDFDDINVSIHGIDARAVRGAPTWPVAFSLFSPWLDGAVVVSHTPFDRAALARASEKHKVRAVDCKWLDTSRVVRRTWPQFSKSGYGLGNVGKFLKIEFKHHDAKEDARAAGEILLLAIQEAGLSVEDWLRRSMQPIDLSSEAGAARSANPNGALFGEVLVFTGALSIPRGMAANAAALAGCEVEEGVTKHTTLLVVGDQDIRVLAGHEKSSKHRKAEDLIARKGQAIRIIGESDFQKMLSVAA